MIDILKDILPYISGLYTLPWIPIGFIVTMAIAKCTGRERIDAVMKKIGLILLYFFVPLLLFRIFLNTNFGTSEIEFAIVVSAVIFFMYALAFWYARYQSSKQGLTRLKRNLYLKTVLTNQGRSSAFIGGAILAIEAWAVPAGIYIALVGIALFAIIPYILSRMHRRESKHPEQSEHIRALPWHLKLFPWYLIAFVVAAVTLHTTTGMTTEMFGDWGTILRFYTAITIPAALYYVGSGIHPRDLKLLELKKLFGADKKQKGGDHWIWVRNIFFLTFILTPLLTVLVFTPLFAIGAISSAWFAVIIINSVLPITSTNMFLISYGIDKKSTALSVTWTTIICVPIVVILITVFGTYL